MAKTGVIYGINGPVVSLAGDPGFQMNEMVYVGKSLGLPQRKQRSRCMRRPVV